MHVLTMAAKYNGQKLHVNATSHLSKSNIANVFLVSSCSTLAFLTPPFCIQLAPWPLHYPPHNGPNSNHESPNFSIMLLRIQMPQLDIKRVTCTCGSILMQLTCRNLKHDPVQAVSTTSVINHACQSSQNTSPQECTIIPSSSHAKSSTQS